MEYTCGIRDVRVNSSGSFVCADNLVTYIASLRRIIKFFHRVVRVCV